MWSEEMYTKRTCINQELPGNGAIGAGILG
jgi:hypothetical protein